MRNVASWLSLTDDQRVELEAFMDEPGFRTLPGSELPSCLPESLRAKVLDAVVILSPTSTGGVYLVFNLHRYDASAGAIDQEPFGLIVHSSGAGPTGVIDHHGDWAGRTKHIDYSLWAAVEESRVGDFFLTAVPSGISSGPLELLPSGDKGAFEQVIRQLRAGADSGRPV